MCHKLCLCATAVVIAQLVDTAMGVPVFFNNRAAFNAAAAGIPLSFEGFEGNWNDIVHGHAQFNKFALDEFTLGDNDIYHATERGAASFSVTEGVDSAWYEDDNATINSTGQFRWGSSIYHAFGLDITFAQGNGSATTSTVTVGGAVASSINLVANVPQFWGVIEPDGMPLSIFFDASGNGFVGFDAVSLGTIPVPEPASFASLALAVVVGAGQYRRRNRTQQ